MTRTPGSWHKSVTSIQTIVTHGGSVSAAIVITSFNYSRIGETIELLRGIGVRRIMLDRVTLAGETLNYPEIIPSRRELTEAFAAANSAAEYQQADIGSNICTPACLLDPLQFPNIGFPVCPNTGTVVSPLIDWLGNIRACTVSPTVIGNIYRDDIETVFDSEYFRKWREPPAFCNHCDRFAACNGGCRGAAEHFGFGPENPDPIIGTMS
jgi:radical SAM protein with 4Fe4S-binding SPASM domain